ncbi:hypothetical protein, partial [Hansschlegelia zhihuaiae]|uniref:hypothetical protein n=1 Tax=Hansschlegelia zhihuaiae TaxID=405005 RepID=UPI0019D49229
MSSFDREAARPGRGVMVNDHETGMVNKMLRCFSPRPAEVRALNGSGREWIAARWTDRSQFFDRLGVLRLMGQPLRTAATPVA